MSNTTDTERIEIRAYTGKEKPVLARTEVVHLPCDLEGSSDEVSRLYRQLEKEYDGVECVVDVGGPREEITDWDGMCPRELEARADDSGSWRREMAMEAGMLHGCAGYNEVLGYD